MFATKLTYTDTGDVRNYDGTCQEEQGKCRHQTNPIDERCNLLREFRAQYPGLDQATINVFVDYEMARRRNHNHNVTNTPVIPDRIKAKHPFAH